MLKLTYQLPSLSFIVGLVAKWINIWIEKEEKP